MNKALHVVVAAYLLAVAHIYAKQTLEDAVKQILEKRKTDKQTSKYLVISQGLLAVKKNAKFKCVWPA
jgi:hypothetical protein